MKQAFACIFIFLLFSQICSAQDLVPFKDSDNKYGYKDRNTDQVVVPAKYRKTFGFRDAPFARVYLGSKYGLVNKKGEEVLPCEYDALSVSKTRELIHLKKDPYWALVNWNFETIIDFDNENERKTVIEENGLIERWIDEKYGFVNLLGEEVIPVKFDKVSRFQHHGSIVSLGDKVAVVSSENKMILELEFSEINYQRGYLIAKKDQFYGLYDTLGNTLEEPIYDEIEIFSEGKIIVKKAGACSLWENGIKTPTVCRRFVDAPDIPAKFRDCTVEEDVKAGGNCAAREIISSIYASLKYPPIAKENNIEGLLVISVTIDVDGIPIDLEVKRALGGGCEEEALRVIKGFKWEVPAQHKGEFVRSKINIPIRFKLE